MGRILTLAQDLRNAGVERVVEVAGWQSRGSSTFNPKVLIEHHTASNRRGGNVPSLGICINGRPGIPGPLCQVLFGRDGTAYVIASGRANHAGAGSWKGVSGNTNAIGFEIENDGIGEPYSAHLREQVRRASVAVLRRIGRDASWCCAHFEWAPTRKIDPGTPKWNMNAWRASLTPGSTPTPSPGSGPVSSKEDDVSFQFVREVETNRVYLLDHTRRVRVHIPNSAAYKTLARLYGMPAKHQDFLRVELDAVSSVDEARGKLWQKIW